MKKDRFVLLDVLKIIFAFLIFVRHSATMGGCKYGIIQVDFLKMINSDFMSLFFIISGFSLYYVYNSKNLVDMKNTVLFYKKRAISILPIYFLVAIVYMIFVERDTNLIWLIPIEFTLTQTYFNGTFAMLHNGTTWFVSCIAFAYFLYPLIQELIKYLSRNNRKILFIIMIIFLSYLPLVLKNINLGSVYSNPLFRVFEFGLGVLLCSLIDYKKKRKNNYVVLFLFIAFLFLEFAYNLFEISFFSYLKYFIFITLIYLASIYKSILNKHRIINFIVSLTYPFYILQIFIWTKTPYINNLIRTIKSNKLRIIVFFAVLFIMSIFVLQFYQKPIEKYFKGKKNDK